MNTLTIDLNELVQLPEFRFRSSANSPSHLESLRRSLRAKGDLDPVLVWKENAEDEHYVILDGCYRVGAYRAECLRGSRGSELIPAEVFKGTRAEAMLAALGANSKDCLPLTNAERMDGAWALVIKFEKSVSKKQLSQASGVSKTTIARMRRTLSSYKQLGESPDESWLLAQNLGKDSNWSPPSNEEREAFISRFTQDLLEAKRNNHTSQIDILAEALERAFSTHGLKLIVDHLGLIEDDTWAMEEDELLSDDDLIDNCCSDF